MHNLAEAKRQFMEYLEIERGRSVKTVENYDRYLDRFFTFAKVKKVGDLTEEQVREFRIFLNRQPGTKVGGRMEPMKRRTQNYYLIALRAFLKFLRKRGIEALSPERIELAKVPERSIDLISAAELRRLMSAPDQKTIEGKRDKAILELLFSTGLRISELCGLSIDDVDLTRDEFSVRGKGDKVRVVFVSDSARSTLQDYLQHRKDMDDAMFTRYGRKMHDGGGLRISPRAVQRLIKQYAVKAGITRKVTPHVIRHSFATDLLQNGADLRSVQALLGHANIATTQVYTHVTDAHLREIHKKYHGK
ncbi:tyrosine-type recombinase/integrase [Candidatus Kaiserbacteria bacterium]|nr:tyrosine-type recombinase/integrase [Candidatus Kaiserbacteria bacterium]